MAKKKTKTVCEVDEFGLYTGPLKEWKLKNPGKIYFDSPFEWRCWMKLKDSNLDFELKPKAIELIPEFKTLGLVKNKIATIKVQDAVYTPDLLIKTKFGKVYIECKGFFRPVDRIRFKLLQYTLLKKVEEEKNIIILIKSDLEFDKLLLNINTDFNFEKSKILKL